MKATNNTELKMERAKSITRKTTYKTNSDNSVTVTVTDAYDRILREETFTREDMINLADEFTNKLVVKDQRKARRESHYENLKILVYAIGIYSCTLGGVVAGQKLFFKLMNKIRK